MIPRLEDLLEKEMANHSSILAWEIPFIHRGAWWATVHGITESDVSEQLTTTNEAYRPFPCQDGI